MKLSIAVCAIAALIVHPVAGDQPADTSPDTVADTLLHVQDAQLSLVSQVNVTAEVAGVIDGVMVREGDEVKQGDVIFRMKNRLAATDMDRAIQELQIAEIQRSNDVDLRYAEKTRDVNERDLQRSLEANSRFARSVSETEIQRLGLVVEQSRLGMEQANRDLESAAATVLLKRSELTGSQLRLAQHEVLSPLEGRVVMVNRQAGEWAIPGDALARIIDLKTLRVEAFVDGNRFGTDLQECRLTFRRPQVVGLDESAPTEFAGRIVFVSPELHPVTGQVRVWGEIDNSAGWLRPGMRGALTIQLP